MKDHAVPFPLWSETEPPARPLGLPMCQNRIAVPMWSHAMEVLPPARILEIGSYNGAFATALGLHAFMIGAPIDTYDLNPPDERIAPIGRALGVTFHAGDVWGALPLIEAKIAAPGVSFVLCDGGDKRRELAALAPALKPGDVIAAHDYDAAHELDPMIPASDRAWPWSEIRKSDGDAVARAHGLVPWLQDRFDTAGWLVYRKVVA